MGREAQVVAKNLEPGSPVRGEYPKCYHVGQKIQAWESDRARQNAKHIERFESMHRSIGQAAELLCVSPGIFVGPWQAAHNLAGLRAAGVTHILNASPLVPCFHNDEFSYMVVKVDDDDTHDLSCHFPATNAFIQEAIQTGGVLVHCYAGVSRSAALTMAYLISVRRMDYIKALKLLKRARPEADPNPGFRSQLQALHESCLQEVVPEVCLLTKTQAAQVLSDESTVHNADSC